MFIDKMLRIFRVGVLSTISWEIWFKWACINIRNQNISYGAVPQTSVGIPSFDLEQTVSS